MIQQDTIRILCVDDNADNIELLCLLMREEGYFVKTAANGAAALLSIQRGLFVLYLLDRLLPDMDGLELIDQIRKYDHNTVLMVSAEAREQEGERALALGIQAYITKPFDQRLRNCVPESSSV